MTIEAINLLKVFHKKTFDLGCSEEQRRELKSALIREVNQTHVDLMREICRILDLYCDGDFAKFQDAIDEVILKSAEELKEDK